MAELVGEHTGDLIFVRRSGNQLTGEVNVAAGNTKSVHFLRVDDSVTEVELVGGQYCEQPLADLIDIGLGGGIVDEAEMRILDLGVGVAQVLLLARVEDIGRSRIETSGSCGAGGGGLSRGEDAR